MANKAQKLISFLFILFSAVIIITFLLFPNYKYLAILFSICVIVPAYFIYPEFFIILLLFINEEGFYLLPRTEIGKANYQDSLYFVMLLLLVIGYMFKKRDIQKTVDFKFFIVTFLFLTFMGIFNSYSNGQPLILGIKAAKCYFLMLFYFVFSFRKINMEKFVKLIIITGILLSILNNIQYLLWGRISIFHYDVELTRLGTLRFLIGDFFTIFAPLIAFGEYLKTGKKNYLLIFLYMVATVVLQGQTRMVIFGLAMSSFLMLYFSKKLNFIKVVFLTIFLIILFVWLAPALEKSLFGKLFKLTNKEITKKEGNFEIRLKGYEYYSKEVMKSPIVGRGIWNDLYTTNNPENLKHKGIHLSDIGIADFLFHFGLLGLIWMLLLFKKIYKVLFKNITAFKQNIHYGILGYFIFGIFSIATLNCFFARRTILYFCLMLVLMSQSMYSERLSEKVK